jgi:hypothetical protein
VDVDRTFSGTLRTRFGSLQEDILVTGDGEASETVSGTTSGLDMVRGTIGEIIDDSGMPQILLLLGLGPLDGGTRAIFFQIVFPPELFRQGDSLTIDYGQVQADAAWVDLATFGNTPAGFIGLGQLTFQTAGTEAGSEVEILFEAPLAVIESLSRITK